MDLKAHHTIKLQNANNKEPVDNNQYVPKIQVCISVCKVLHFKSLTRLRDFFIKSHEIYETF